MPYVKGSALCYLVFYDHDTDNNGVDYVDYHKFALDDLLYILSAGL